MASSIMQPSGNFPNAFSITDWSSSLFCFASHIFITLSALCAIQGRYSAQYFSCGILLKSTRLLIANGRENSLLISCDDTASKA